MNLIKAAKLPIHKTLAVLGLEIRKTQKPLFYQPHPTCQIPQLDQLYRRFFGQKRDGRFVEVGAFDGETYSNTSCLADLGWQGLYIEPVPAFADLCAARHKNNRVEVLRSAVGKEKGTLQLHVRGAFSSAEDVSGEKISVPIRTLDAIFEEKAIAPHVDLVVIDVEDMEKEVLEGFTLSRWKPRMIIIETHLKKLENDQAITKTIQDAGYYLVFRDLINSVFVSLPL